MDNPPFQVARACLRPEVEQYHDSSLTSLGHSLPFLSALALLRAFWVQGRRFSSRIVSDAHSASAESSPLYTPSALIIPRSPCAPSLPRSAGVRSGIHTACSQSGCGNSCIIPHSTHSRPVRFLIAGLLPAIAPAAASWQSMYGLSAARSTTGKDKFTDSRAMYLLSSRQYDW